MTIEQMIEIPAAHRIFLDLPSDLPIGRAKIELTITPEFLPKNKSIKPLKTLLGIHKGLDTMDAYFMRKQADKALEETQFKNSRKAQ